jgi:hypothetical protein
LPRLTLLWFVSLAAFAVGLSSVSCATTGNAIRVWKVGSPYRGDTPDTAVPVAIAQDANRRRLRVGVEAFPAKGFAATFSDAVKRKSAPDVLVFDNYGVMNGTTTTLGSFDGIGQDPVVRKNLIWVTGAFDELLGPARGWTYLFTSSPNYKAARMLALKTPECPNGPYASMVQGELPEIVPKVATAYMKKDSSTLHTYSDPDRLPAMSSDPEIVNVAEVQTCGLWGNSRLAFAWVNVSYEAETKLGHALVLIVFRNRSSRWQLLTASRDPISNGAFVKQVPSMAASFVRNTQTLPLPAPAMLLSPADGEVPAAPDGGRFGSFTWRQSPSDDVVAEIAEFGYHDDARLFLLTPQHLRSNNGISAGQLWTTRSLWKWRIWSVTRAGDVVFSDVRTFPH